MKYITLLFSVLLVSCSGTTNVVDVEYGIQCEFETTSSSYDVRQLPANINAKIIDHLNITYGAPRFSEGYEVNDLKFVGDYTVCQKRVRYWEYKCTNKCWVAVQPYMNSYMIGVVDQLPPGNHLTK